MRPSSQPSTFRLAALAIAFLAAVPARAAVFRQGQTVVIGADERIEEDLYVAAERVEIQGELAGDLVVAAGDLVVTGTIEGDLIAAAGNARIEGVVAESARVAAGSLTVSGRVAEDLVVAGGNVVVGPGARVRNDALLAGGDLRIDGSIGRDVRASTGSLTLGDGARVGGKLSYASGAPAAIAAGARIEGPVERAPVPTWRIGAAAIVLLWFRLLVGLLAFGLLLVLAVPRFVLRGADALSADLGRSLAWGILVALGTPVVAFVVFQLGVLVGGWWIGVVLLVALGLAWLAAFVVGALAIGRAVLARFGRTAASAFAAVALGTLVLMLVLAVPFLGALVVFATMLAGLGAIARTLYDARRSSSRTTPLAPAVSREAVPGAGHVEPPPPLPRPRPPPESRPPA